MSRSLYFRGDYSLFPSEPCEGVCLPLTKNRHALIDSADYELVATYKWHYDYPGYSRTNSLGKAKMHRLIMSFYSPSQPMVDHINGNGLDNRRINLRQADKKQNSGNWARSEKYRGICFHKKSGKWQARIGTKKGIYIGIFACQEDAAKAYDLAAIEYYGEFARLNFPLEVNNVQQ